MISLLPPCGLCDTVAQRYGSSIDWVLVFDQCWWWGRVVSLLLHPWSREQRTSTDRISTRTATSSAQSKSVNDSVLKDVPTIPRCTKCSSHQSVGLRKRFGATTLQPCLTPLRTENQSNPSTRSPLTVLQPTYHRKFTKSLVKVDLGLNRNPRANFTRRIPDPLLQGV